jgi:hypothetical protein
MTAVAAVGVTAALAVLQLAPAFGPTASLVARATPLDIPPQQVAFLGVGAQDVAVYRTELSQVCPATGPLDCIENERYVRTPFTLPPDVRAGNVTLSPTGDQLAIVGHKGGEDVIAVVMMPRDADSLDDGKGGKPGNQGPQTTSGQIAQRTHDSGNGLGQPTVAGGPDSTPPSSAVPGLTVLSILDNVQSAGSSPDWSANGGMLAFSAMPDDRSTGPDVYVWSPGDSKARPITKDHTSYFASWSGNRIVVSRISAGQTKPHNYVIDPGTLEERAVGGPQMWLPTVDRQRVQAIGWYGQLDTTGLLPEPRSGALYIEDWRLVDPFGTAAVPAPTPLATPSATPQPTPTPTLTPTLTPTPTSHTTDEPSTSEPTLPLPTNNGRTPPPEATDEPAHTATPDEEEPSASPTQAPTSNAPSAPATSSPDTTSVELIAVEPDRDPRSAPVLDWQARWSGDGEVLGVWVADSSGSTWGRLTVFAADATTELVTGEIELLPTTLARRGFTLGTSRVAWVGPSDDNIDGDLRIRTWGTDGNGSLRLRAPSQEEVTPAS